MASIYPFHGVRYNEARVGNLDDVVTPPYDVISQDEQQWYLGKHPNNVVRLILPREMASNGSPMDKYQRSASCLREWLESGVLVRDAEPSLYICEQTYEINGQRKSRLGFTCLVRLEDFENRTVLPHENVLAKPLGDRFELLRTARADFDSVFGLYASGAVDQVLRPFLLHDPDATAVDKAGVLCNMWKVSDPDAIQEVVTAMADETILIADGHHRYTAALTYRNEMREKHGTVDLEAPWEFVMMTLVSFEDKGLVILPTHRLVKNIEGFSTESFLDRLSEQFDITSTGKEEMVDAVDSSGGRHVFGLYLGGRSYRIELKSEVKPEVAIQSPGSDALKRLDVSVLHSLILERLLGISTQQLSAQSNLAYKRDLQETFDAVDSGEYQMAFFMKSPRVDEVKAVAAEGDRMPQKSTFFYPKLLTGMVMYVMATQP